MTDAHMPQDDPEEPAQAPDGRASTSMPPDPFNAQQAGATALHIMYTALRSGGFTLGEACLIIAANIAVNATMGSRQQDGPQA